MPRLLPFRGLRYDPARIVPDDVVAPPYDVVSPAERARLAARSPYQAIRVELPEARGPLDSYRAAAADFADWESSGVLLRDEEPRLYAYRMRYPGRDGSTRTTDGVLGALVLGSPEDEDVLPHEQTLPKAKSDRLALLEATRVNTSPIWGLSLARGLSALLRPDGPPAFGAEAEGVRHELWPLPRAVADAVSHAVGGAPVVIADGHHRWETAQTFAAEQDRPDTSQPRGLAPWDLAMAFVVELSADQLEVGPIHRLVSGLEPGALAAALKAGFELEPLSPEAGVAGLEGLAEAAGAPVLLAGTQRFALVATAGTVAAADEDLDSARLAVVLSSVADAEVAYANSADEVSAALASGEATAAILVRPATVAQIAEVARRRRRMPPKSTFFRPKPRTGMVFRPLSD